MKDLSNKKFGKWTVTNNFVRKGKHINWECVCECGVKRFVTASNLQCGKSSSCIKCSKKRILNDKKQMQLNQQILKQTYWMEIKNCAKKRKIKFEISIEDANSKFTEQNGLCVYTNLPLTFDSYSRSYDGTASLDRIDSNKGYIKDNIQWVHKTINRMKWDLDEQNFLLFCNLVANKGSVSTPQILT